MNVRKFNSKNPKPKETWAALETFDNGIGAKLRLIVIKGISGNQVEYYKCTTNPNAPGAYHVMDQISAGMYRDTYVVPRTKRMSISNLAHRCGVLSRFDIEALRGLEE